MKREQFEDENFNFKKDEEVLEISSTGYGLESVSKSNINRRKPNEDYSSGSEGI